jgi:hypothetical protein
MRATPQMGFFHQPAVIPSNPEHDPGELDGYRPGRAVLPAGTTVPAFVRVANIHFIAFHVDHIEGADLAADPASRTFVPINDWWHAFLPHSNCEVPPP